MMESLGKYASDDEQSQNNSDEVKQNTASATLANLESEWENFEKMLAGSTNEFEDNDTPEVTTDAAPTVEATDSTKPCTSVYNPYAYLSQYSATSAATTDSTGTTAADMEKQLEEFLERTAQAASSEISKEADETVDSDGSHTDHSESESDHHSNNSGRSRSSSRSDTDKPPSIDKSPKEGSVHSPVKDGSDLIKKLDEMNKLSCSTSNGRRSSHRRSHSPARRPSHRSHRSRSRSRRSRSRSRRRHHRHRRSSSRNKHGSSRRRRRSGSRHRHRTHRSRSPRHRHESSRYRSSRHKKSRRRSRSRSRDIKRTTRKAMYGNPPQAKPPAQEDFKAKMKRELQQAAKDAMAGKGQATPQQALLQTMAAMHAKAQELTGVEIPKFYNPAAINPLKFAEQQQKRKLLWSKAAQNKEQSLQKFQGTEVVADEKYRKLMGIKGQVELGEQSNEQKQKQDELFAKLDQEYAMARLTTHTHRGMGLGIVSSIAAASANEQMNRP